MKKIIIALLALAAVAAVVWVIIQKNQGVNVIGEGDVKCHIEGTMANDNWGDIVIICPEEVLPTDVDDNYYVKATGGKFSCDVLTDFPRRYRVYLKKQYENNFMMEGLFLAENDTVRITILEDGRPVIASTGEEGRKHEVMDSIEQAQFSEPINTLLGQLYDKTREKEYFKTEYLSAMAEMSSWGEGKEPSPALEDSIQKVLDHYNNYYNERYTDAGLKIQRQLDSIQTAKDLFRLKYYVDHPMLWALCDVLKASENLFIHSYATNDYNFSKNVAYNEALLRLYDNKLSTLYPDHPVHQQIAEVTSRLPGKPYIDYDVHTPDGEAVPISSLIKGKVALIDLWASWCEACRVHSKAIIPIYEKYKDKGFTVVAIAREKNRSAMEKAMEKDGYPWPSMMEPIDDDNNGTSKGGGAMILVDRDGTILSRSTDAEVLEPLIKKALNVN